MEEKTRYFVHENELFIWEITNIMSYLYGRHKTAWRPPTGAPETLLKQNWKEISKEEFPLYLLKVKLNRAR